MRYVQNFRISYAVLFFSARLCTGSTEASPTFSDLSAALDSVAWNYKATIGCEIADKGVNEKPITLNLRNLKISAALDRITAQRPIYDWRLKDGIYYVYPRARNGGRVSDILVKNFSIHNASIGDAIVAISELPEVAKWLKRHGTHFRELEVGSETHTQRVSLTLSSATVSHILDSLAKKLGQRRWTVVHYGGHGEYLAIYL
ncbi:MAG TPA: hypothetical protein VJP02_32030 [Candidatus Sulfotelmatobacter sp.]|nr:hypothetical protein [Candidatus Sulfotelmatobacter sp.]